MAFNHPEAFWLLLIVPIMIIIWPFLGLLNKRDRNRFAQSELFETLTRSISGQKHRIRQFSFVIGVTFLTVALTGPRFGTRTEIIKRTGVDIVIALDTSYSMLAEDFKPNRIMQSKYEINRLIDNLMGDRVALMAFAGDAVVQCPLTTDYGAAKTLLESIDVGVAPIPGTNLENAIDGALDLLSRGSVSGSESQLVVLVTDGESISGNPEQAARRAAGKNIRIFTIGVGSTTGEIIPIRNGDGQLEDYKKDKNGNVVKTKLDERTLSTIAEKTGASYLRAAGGEVDVQAIIDALGSMHKADLHERKISRLKERYQIPLGIALFFLLVWYGVGERRRSFNPRAEFEGGL